MRLALCALRLLLAVRWLLGGRLLGTLDGGGEQGDLLLELELLQREAMDHDFLLADDAVQIGDGDLDVGHGTLTHP